MYEVIKNVLESGRYELSDMLKKINIIWLEGGVTDDQKTELVKLAQEKADYTQCVEVMEKLKELDKRVAALEKSGVEPGEKYPDYMPGKWCYKGDKITYNGKKYTCVAPDTQVCTWSPDEYPTYWQEVPE